MAKLIQAFATYGPRIDLEKAADSGTFKGRIKNSANIGLTREQYVAMWNRDHPEDPILL